MEPKMIGIAQAAQTLGVHRDSVRRRVVTGEIRSTRIGRRILIPVTEIERICRDGCGKYTRPELQPQA